MASDTPISHVPAIIWTKNLRNLPKFSTKQIEKHLQSCGKKEIGSRGYKFFSENYIHDCYVGYENAVFTIKARCFKSQRKNEDPHNLTLNCKADSGGSANIIATSCSCKAG